MNLRKFCWKNYLEGNKYVDVVVRIPTYNRNLIKEFEDLLNLYNVEVVSMKESRTDDLLNLEALSSVEKLKKFQLENQILEGLNLVIQELDKIEEKIKRLEEKLDDMIEGAKEN